MVDVYQYEYNGLVIGDFTDYEVTSVDGLNPPDIRGEIFPKAGASGSWIYGVDLGERHIIFEGKAVDPADPEGLKAALDAAFAPQSTPQPLTFMLRETTWTIDCVPLRLHYQMTEQFGKGVLVFMVELVAEDPTISEAEGS
jgi:hypothetical protein